MKVKTSELTGAALDWAVAKCEGFEARNNTVVFFTMFGGDSSEELKFECFAEDNSHAIEQLDDAHPGCCIDRIEQLGHFSPSTDWSQGGPIIEREKIGVWWTGVWHAKYDGCEPEAVQDSDHPLIAAMRCYVASKLGDEIGIPEELSIISPLQNTHTK